MKKEYLGMEIEVDEDLIAHYGVKRRSGRYPWGSGKDPNQHEGAFSFRKEYKRLKDSGLTESQIAQNMGFKSTTELRKQVSIAKEISLNVERETVLAMHARGSTVKEISAATGIKSVTKINNIINKDPSELTSKEKASRTQIANVKDSLKTLVDEKGYIDVGKGVEVGMGITQTKLNASLKMLQDEGYYVTTINQRRLDDPNKTTTIKVLSKNPDKQDIWKNHRDEIVAPNVYTEDHGMTIQGIKPPKHLSWDRVKIRYKEDGGEDRDGTIELRPGAEGLDLGKSHYAQVRIAVGDNSYLKGMAYYNDKMPKGVDVIFNTNKAKGTPREKVLKELKNNPENPFGAVINRQKGYLNIVNEEGDWNKWSSGMSAQFLSKQPLALVKDRLKATSKQVKSEFDEIMSIPNPVVRKKLLEDFAGSCETRAIKLKAKGLARTRAQVILPLTDINPNQIFAPNYKNGERVVLVRYPHAGRFEAAEVTVNNNIKSGIKHIGKNALDAIGIHPSVARKLSGADFDGDTAYVFPNNNRSIKTAKALEGLRDFDPGVYAVNRETMTKKTRNLQMGIVSNLITDMSLAKNKPTADELARAVRHSMVVIDALKHKYDYKQSAKDNRIAELVEKYQSHVDPTTGKKRNGAATIVSKSRSQIDIPVIDKKGNPVIDKKTGKVKTTKDVRMRVTDDAMTLVRDKTNGVEIAYANYANEMKAYQKKAQAIADSLPKAKYDKSLAAKGGKYEKEVKSINEKYNNSVANKPRERQAQLLANKYYYSQRPLYLDENGRMDPEDATKLRTQTTKAARAATGSQSGKNKIIFTEKEWEAVEAGAISSTRLNALLKESDMEVVRKYATPRQKTTLSASRIAQIKSMQGRYTQAEIAKALGLTVSQVNNALNGD